MGLVKTVNYPRRLEASHWQYHQLSHLLDRPSEGQPSRRRIGIAGCACQAGRLRGDRRALSRISMKLLWIGFPSPHTAGLVLLAGVSLPLNHCGKFDINFGIRGWI